MALDTANEDPASVETVIDLASRLEAAVLGLFVEDVNLLRTAGLPFTRRIGLLTGTQQAIDAAAVEREAKAAAGRVHRFLAAAAERRRVRFSFRVVRGHFAHEVARASVEGDLTVVEEARGRELPRFLRNTRTFVELAQAPVLLLRAEVWLGRPVLVVLDGDSAGRRVLALAAHLAARGGSGRLEIISSPTDAFRAEALESEVRAFEGCDGLELGFSLCPRLNVHGIERALRQAGAGLVVVRAGSALLAGSDPSRLADELRCPVLVAR